MEKANPVCQCDYAVDLCWGCHKHDDCCKHVQIATILILIRVYACPALELCHKCSNTAVSDSCEGCCSNLASSRICMNLESHCMA